MVEESRRLWLRLNYKANDTDRCELIKMMRVEYGEDSTAYFIIKEYERLCEYRVRLERNDKYYKSMHHDSDQDENDQDDSDQDDSDQDND